MLQEIQTALTPKSEGVWANKEKEGGGQKRGVQNGDLQYPKGNSYTNLI